MKRFTKGIICCLALCFCAVGIALLVPQKTTDNSMKVSASSEIEIPTPDYTFTISQIDSATFSAVGMPGSITIPNGTIQSIIDAIDLERETVVKKLVFGDGEIAIDLGSYSITFGNGTYIFDGKVNVDTRENGAFRLIDNAHLHMVGGAISRVGTHTGSYYSLLCNQSNGSINIHDGVINIGGSGQVTIRNTSGGTVNILGGTINSNTIGIENYAGTLNIYGGNINATGNGVAIYNRGITNVYGGVISGASAGGSNSASGTIYSDLFGGSSNTVNIFGGLVTTNNGVAVHSGTGSVRIFGGTIQATHYNGCALDSGDLEISEIDPLKPTLITSPANDAGAFDNATIRMTSGSLTISGGTIENTNPGSSTRTTNTIYLGSDCSATIEGGVITNIGVHNNSTAISLNGFASSYTTLYMSGGKISSNRRAIYTGSSTRVTISGESEITSSNGNTSSGTIYLNSADGSNAVLKLLSGTVTNSVSSGNVIYRNYNIFGIVTVVELAPAEISNESANIDKVFSGTETLSATVTSPVAGVTFQYQWFKDNVAIIGATGATRTVSAIADSGEYKLRVTTSLSSGVVSEEVFSNPITVSISKASGVGSVSMANWAFGGTASNPTYDNVTPEYGTPTIRYKVKDSDDSTYTSTKPTNVGEYTVRAVWADSANYFGYTAYDDFEITKAQGGTVSNPTESSKTATSITLNTVSNPSGQTVEYGINTTNNSATATWQDSRIFTGLNANTTYFIFARSKENANYFAGDATAGLQITTPTSGPQAQAPTITTTTLPNGTTGTAYSQTLAATGDATITWSHDSGDLPNGLTLNANGTITGTPTAAGTFTFTVKATNSAGNDTKELSITIAAASTGGDNNNDDNGDNGSDGGDGDGSNVGLIVGATVGGIAAAGAIGGGIFWFIRRRKV